MLLKICTNTAGLASACRAARLHLLGALCTMRNSSASQQNVDSSSTAAASLGAGAGFSSVDTQGVAADRLIDLEAMCDAHETELLRGQLQAATALRNYLNKYAGFSFYPSNALHRIACEEILFTIFTY